MTLSMVTVPALAAGAGPAASSNVNGQDQTFYAALTVQSYLFENETGGLTRVEHTGGQIGGQILVEDYSPNFAFQGSRSIPMELTDWGGFFAGEDYNFFVFGQTNPQELDSVEVIRVVKYSKDWQRLGQASLYGANTTIPFDAGSLRMDEYGGQLYIRTSHEMYTSSDGLRHQANLTLCVDEEAMEVLDSYYAVMNSSVGYVSHSFNQFVLVDQEKNIVTLDHGDAYPRSAVLMTYDTKAGSGKFSGSVRNYTIQEFPGQTGDNTTGASLGGLVETDSGYLVAYNYNGTGGGSPAERTVYLSYVPKNGGSASSRPISSAGTTTPQMVATGLNSGYVLWNGKEGNKVGDTLYYVSYDGTGGTGAVQTAAGSLSDCAPIYYNGKAVWYTTDNSLPVFYTLDSSGVRAYPVDDSQSQPEPTPDPGSTPVFQDVPASHWAYPYITRAAENGWVSGIGGGKFAPDDTLTFAQFYAMVTPIFEGENLAKCQQAPGAPWWYRYMTVGAEYLMANTIWVDTQPLLGEKMTLEEAVNTYADQPISRTDAISIMWRALGAWSANKIVPGVDAARELSLIHI